MLKPSENPLVSGSQNRYSLVIGVAKRAREISEESENKGTILVEKPVDLAVQEYMNNKYRIVEKEAVEEEEAPVEEDLTEAESVNAEPEL